VFAQVRASQGIADFSKVTIEGYPDSNAGKSKHIEIGFRDIRFGLKFSI
jgi:hypothetical protein